MNRKGFIVLFLMAAPLMSMADDTRCTSEISEVKMEAGFGKYLGELSIKGTAFSGSYIPICSFHQDVPTGKMVGPNLGAEVDTDAVQCDRLLTAAELALALEMKLVLGYESTVQSDCETLNDGAYPYFVEIHKK